MEEKDYLQMDINNIDLALDNIYEAKDNLLDVDDFSNEDFNKLCAVIDILEQLKITKENKLIHEKGIKMEYV